MHARHQQYTVMKYFFIVGEASGDLHASNLIRYLRMQDNIADISGWGGDKMIAEGAKVTKHYKELAFMGFTEVIMNINTIRKNFKVCKEEIKAFSPDVLVLVDYPGFNLRMAKWAKEKGLTVIYYISPQIWAWKENRIHSIKKYVDKMLVILPFEKTFYEEKWNYPVDYVGHPLLEVVDRFTDEKEEDSNPFVEFDKFPNIIALLPGSRQQEIAKKLPIMLKVSKRFPQYHFVVAKADGVPVDFYNKALEPYANVTPVINKTYELLYYAKAALVTSGTATLETALFGVPQIICYKGGSISYQIAKRLIKVKYIGLVNLILDKEVVPELIQNDLNPDKLTATLTTLLHSKEEKARIQKDYAALRTMLQPAGNASANAAKIIYDYMKKKNF